MARQRQFLDVIDRDRAERRFRDALRLEPLEAESVDLDAALDRVLAEDIVATTDVPSFDRSNYDGFAVRAEDTYGAGEQSPIYLRLLGEVLATGVVPREQVVAETAITIATGGMLPRGADAVVMVEHTDVQGNRLCVRRAVTPGFGVSFAGTDIGRGETVLRRGDRLTSRDTGVLAAIGVARLPVVRRPKVAIVSTGDEIIRPGEPMRPGAVYDSNGRILADAVRELGGEPVYLGIVRDAIDLLQQTVRQAIDENDVVLLSGGTSKGEGDLSYVAASRLTDPGIVAHGVALKPGKPICLAASSGKPVVILPGFPTSAIFTFHEFVAPVIRILAGRAARAESTRMARMAVRVNSEIGRTEYLLVNLVEEEPHEDARQRLVAYPIGKGSGSVTTFSRADGFVTIGRHEEIVEAGNEVSVQLIGDHYDPADLLVMGSHCIGLDYLLGRVRELGFRTKVVSIGSTAGLAAVARGECDAAAVHLLDEATGEYNRPFLTEGLELVPGYRRRQGVLFRSGDRRFEDKSAEAAVDAAVRDAACRMVNRNQGSGTRILIDRLLKGRQPPGYPVQARNHNTVAVAIAQGRADWGVAIEPVARQQRLGFLPLIDEQYDMVVRTDRQHRPAVAAFVQLFDEPAVQRELGELGFEVTGGGNRSRPSSKSHG